MVPKEYATDISATKGIVVGVSGVPTLPFLWQLLETHETYLETGCDPDKSFFSEDNLLFLLSLEWT